VPVHHQPSAAAKGAVGANGDPAADPIKHDIDTVAGELADALCKAALGVVDRGRAQGRDHPGLGPGTRSVELQARKPPELKQGRAHAARRAMHQDPFSLPCPGGAVQHLVGGDIVEHHDGRLGGVEPLWNRHQPPPGNAQIVSVAAIHGDGPDPLTGFEPACASTQLVHGSDELVTGGEWGPGSPRVGPLPDEDVGVAHARGEDSHPDLSRSRLGDRLLDDRHHLRPSVARHNDPPVPPDRPAAVALQWLGS